MSAPAPAQAVCILDSLSPKDHVAIAEHVGSCASCQTRLMESRDFASRIAELVRWVGKDWRERRRYLRIAENKPAAIRVLRPANSGKVSIGRVLQTSREGFRLSVGEFLPTGTSVQIHVEDTIALGEVRYCTPDGAVYHAGIQVRDSFPAPLQGAFESRRRELRSTVLAVADLSVAGSADVHQVTVLDVSKSGMRVRSKIPIPPSTRVELSCRGAAISGEVRYTRELGPDEFNMGLSAHTFSGQHINGDGELDLTRVFNLH